MHHVNKLKMNTDTVVLIDAKKFKKHLTIQHSININTLRNMGRVELPKLD